MEPFFETSGVRNRLAFEASITTGIGAESVWTLTVPRAPQARHQSSSYPGQSRPPVHGLGVITRGPEAAQVDDLGVVRHLAEGVVGIEDKTYLHWQLAILCESLIGQLPNGWEVLVVVCNDHQPISNELRHILDAYGVRHFTGANHPVRENMDFATGPDWYLILNKIEALRAVGHVLEDDDVVCLMDTDIFLYRELDPSIFPEGNALCANWIISQELFFEGACGGGPGLVDLQGLLGSIGCTQEFRPGGVTIFFDGKTAKSEKIVNDCFRFSQILYLLGKVGDLPEVWVSEMPSYALSLTANGVPYDVIDEGNHAFVITKPESIPAGSFYHYYADFGKGDLEGAFLGSTWSKQQFRDFNFLSTEIEVFLEKAVTDHERYFFELALRAQRRLAFTRMHTYG